MMRVTSWTHYKPVESAQVVQVLFTVYQQSERQRRKSVWDKMDEVDMYEEELNIRHKYK